MLECGSKKLGDFLEMFAYDSIPNQLVLEVLTNGGAERLREIATFNEMCCKLHEEWRAIFSLQVTTDNLYLGTIINGVSKDSDELSTGDKDSCLFCSQMEF